MENLSVCLKLRECKEEFRGGIPSPLKCLAEQREENVPRFFLP